ncbi:Hypothetical protein, putative [Bodo saltans]|uniref:Uncharacterized protein n=1 Tax=Bodo saltans TaxID=75058 RepID=A0A0S4ITE8_BODSA|nr:Hypothetical protein, putative [Bodo saltans]|eukprot:CUF76166.1 Hypothetical protein, putative [Bodo saltans]
MNPFSDLVVAQSSSAAAGRQYTVLLHVDGARKILRDVTLTDTQDVLELVALHAQLRSEFLLGGEHFPVVEYFDDRQQSFLELTELSWPRVSAKRHMELRTGRRGGAANRQLTSSNLHQQAAAWGDDFGHDHHHQRNSDDAISASRNATAGATTNQSSNGAASSETGGGSRRQAANANGILSTSTLKAHVVDATRRCLARDFPYTLSAASASAPPQQGDSIAGASMRPAMPTLVRICAAIGDSDAAMNETRSLAPSLEAIDAISKDVEPFVRHAVEVASREGWLAPPPPAAAAAAAHKNATAAAHHHTAPTAVSIPIERPKLLTTPSAAARSGADGDAGTSTSASAMMKPFPIGGVVPPPLLTKIVNSNNSNHDTSGPPSVVAVAQQAAAAVAAQQHRPVLPPRLLEADANGYYDKTTVRPNGAAGSVKSGAASSAGGGQTSTFQQVRYSVCGPFPPPLFNTADEQQAPTIRVSLSAPSSSILPDEDILITAHVMARTVTSLTWWLGYGPNRITLNMDDMYRRGSVTTFQVSETGLLLTIRRGTLVPGWQYHVYLSASSEITGVTAADQTTFVLNKSATQAGMVVAAASRTAGALLNGVTSVRQLHLRGYDGDEDREGDGPAARNLMLLTPTAKSAAQQQAGGASNLSNADPAHLAATGGGGGGAADFHNHVSLSSADVQRQQGIASTSGNPMGMTFQEQLKQFFVNEMQPLYRLCNRPNIRQQDFNEMLQQIAQSYWYSKSPDATFDIGLQREIVERVKNAVISHRSMHRAVNEYRYGSGGSDSAAAAALRSRAGDSSPSRTRGGGMMMSSYSSKKSATDIPPAGLRPQFQSLIR